MKIPSAVAKSRGTWVGLMILALFFLSLHCQLATGQKDAVVAVDSDAVLVVAYSPDGRMLAGAGFDKAIRIWEASTGKVLLSLEGPKRTTRRSVAFLPDGQMLAGGGDDGVIHLWNVHTGKLERSISASVPGIQHIQSIAISSDGGTLAVATAVMKGKDRSVGELTLLDLKSGKVLWTKARDKMVYSVTFSPDGKMLAAGDGEVHLLASESGALIKKLWVKDRLSLKVVFSPDGKTLAGAGGQWIAVDGGTQQISEVFLWDVKTGGLLRKLTDLYPWVASLAFSPDGSILATGSSGPIKQKGGMILASSEIRLWDPQNGKLLRKIPGELGRVWSLAFSPDGKSLLSCDGEAVALTETLTGLRRLELMKRTLKPFAPEK